ncbi:hypothetical protein N0G65_003547 [Providencia rettgeri]|nr:hypothetical protein [Providencia rettgeri]
MKRILMLLAFMPIVATSDGVPNPVKSVNNLKELVCKDSKFKNQCLRSVDAIIASSYTEGMKVMYCKLNGETPQVKNDAVLQEECKYANEFIGNISENE